MMSPATNQTDPAERARQRIPDQMNQAMVVIDMKSWIAIATILLVLVAILLWGFFGTMELKRAASGVLVKSGRTITLYAPEDSVLLNLGVQRDQYIDKDQVVARLDQSALVEQINAMIENNADPVDLDLARAELLRRSQIICYDEGRVKDVFVHAGDHLSKGQKIATLIQSPPKGKNLSCLLFLPMDQMRSVKKGMQVNIYPDFADKNTYGNMIGTIASISEYPVSDNYMLDALGSQELASGFTQGGACFELTISLLTSEQTPTGYYWTTSAGPSIEIGDLSLCSAELVLNTLRPIDVFLFNK